MTLHVYRNVIVIEKSFEKYVCVGVCVCVSIYVCT